MEAVPSECKVMVGDNCTCLVKGFGNISFVTVGGEEMVISDVLYVLDLCKTVSLMVTHKMSVLF